MKSLKRLSRTLLVYSAAIVTFLLATMSAAVALLGPRAQPGVRERAPVERDEGPTKREEKRRRRQDWVVRQLAAGLMNLLIIAAVAGAWAVLWLAPRPNPPGLDWPTLALKGFALWCLAFLPCWLYVRFLGQRAEALWEEYILNLHRLGWDRPRFLPRPPVKSEFHQEWVDDDGPAQPASRSIYRQKFDAYYGRSASATADGKDFKVRLDTLFPVFLTAAVLAVAWTAVLWDDQFLRDPSDVWDVLKFGFLGAYVFIAQMLLRRFFASDLRPSAYASALLRIIVVLISVAAIYQLLEIWLAGNPHIHRWEAVVAFVIGFLPVVAMQVLVHAASAPLRTSTRMLASDYPLSQLDGLNVWYEARLAEENIDDMENLSTANFVDVMLHTRVPVGRLVDWVDQAFLFLHVDRVERGVRENNRAHRSRPAGGLVNAPLALAEAGAEAGSLSGGSVGPGSRGGTRTRTGLRQLGIRTATDLIKAFPPEQIDPAPDAAVRDTELGRTLDEAGLSAGQVRTLVRVLSEDQGLAPVWNWHDRGVLARSTRRRPRSLQVRDAGFIRFAGAEPAGRAQ